VGYCRVSTDEQAREGISLNNQREKIEVYCKLNDFTLVEIITDEEISAKNLNRAGIQKVLDMAKKRQIEGIIIYKLDREFRNTVDALNVAKNLDKQGVALHSISERLDTKSAIGGFFFTLMAGLAEMERRQIAERTADALRCKKRNGEKTGGDVPFGFKMVVNGDKKALESLEGEQANIRLMKRLRAAGKSYREIGKMLEAKEITTKRGGKKWFPMTVKQVFDRAAN
jgi:site-specific DNA recombinase